MPTLTPTPYPSAQGKNDNTDTHITPTHSLSSIHWYDQAKKYGNDDTSQTSPATLNLPTWPMWSKKRQLWHPNSLQILSHSSTPPHPYSRLTGVVKGVESFSGLGHLHEQRHRPSVQTAQLQQNHQHSGSVSSCPVPTVNSGQQNR